MRLSGTTGSHVGQESFSDLDRLFLHFLGSYVVWKQGVEIKKDEERERKREGRG